MRVSIDYNGISYQNYDYDELVSLLGKDSVDIKLHEAHIAEVRELRKQAYILEADPLYIEWQYDQTPEKEKQWREKVAEIKAKYPLV